MTFLTDEPAKFEERDAYDRGAFTRVAVAECARLLDPLKPRSSVAPEPVPMRPDLDQLPKLKASLQPREKRFVPVAKILIRTLAKHKIVDPWQGKPARNRAQFDREVQYAARVMALELSGKFPSPARARKALTRPEVEELRQAASVACTEILENEDAQDGRCTWHFCLAAQRLDQIKRSTRPFRASNAGF